jgi:hypothetical protein
MTSVMPNACKLKPGFSVCVRTCFLKKLSRFSGGAAAFRLLKCRKTLRRLQLCNKSLTGISDPPRMKL